MLPCRFLGLHHCARRRSPCYGMIRAALSHVFQASGFVWDYIKKKIREEKLEAIQLIILFLKLEKKEAFARML